MKFSKFLGSLTYAYALRGLLCMMPMIIALLVGRMDMVVPFGQVGFFYSMLPVADTMKNRILTGILLLGFGLAFYLFGANLVHFIPIGYAFIFFGSFAIGWATSMPALGMLYAPLLISLMAAGLNTSSVDSANISFIAFGVAIVWGTLVTLLPIYKPLGPYDTKPSKIDRNLIFYGTRLGLGTSIALFVGHLFGFAKLGWAPSAVGNVVRNEPEVTLMRSKFRILGVIIGSLIAAIVFAIFGTNFAPEMFIVVLLAVLTGLTLGTNLKFLPIGYNAGILILYSLSNPDGLIIPRILYNTVGITIGLLVTEWAFPIVVRKLEERKIIKPDLGS